MAQPTNAISQRFNIYQSVAVSDDLQSISKQSIKLTPIIWRILYTEFCNKQLYAVLKKKQLYFQRQLYRNLLTVQNSFLRQHIQHYIIKYNNLINLCERIKFKLKKKQFKMSKEVYIRSSGRRPAMMIYKLIRLFICCNYVLLFYLI